MKKWLWVVFYWLPDGTQGSIKSPKGFATKEQASFDLYSRVGGESREQLVPKGGLITGIVYREVRE